MTDNGKQKNCYIPATRKCHLRKRSFRKIDSVSMNKGHRQIEVHQQIINVKMFAFAIVEIMHLSISYSLKKLVMLHSFLQIEVLNFM